MNSMISERAKQFQAWKKLLSKRPVKPRNRFHDFDDFQKMKEREEPESSNPERSDLSDELASWEAASDVDFEKFESSLDRNQ